MLGNMLDILPFWILILLIFIVGYAIIYAITSLVLGKGVTDHVFGEIIGIFHLPVYTFSPLTETKANV